MIKSNFIHLGTSAAFFSLDFPNSDSKSKLVRNRRVCRRWKTMKVRKWTRDERDRAMYEQKVEEKERALASLLEATSS
jgi:hypothetical protein